MFQAESFRTGTGGKTSPAVEVGFDFIMRKGIPTMQSRVCSDPKGARREPETVVRSPGGGRGLLVVILDSKASRCSKRLAWTNVKMSGTVPVAPFGG